MDAATLGTLATGLLAVVALLVKAWLSKEPQRDKEKRDEETQTDRAAIANGDAAALGAAIDSVPATHTGDTAGLGTDPDIARRLAEISNS